MHSTRTQQLDMSMTSRSFLPQQDLVDIYSKRQKQLDKVGSHHWWIQGESRHATHGPHPLRQSGHKISKIGATRCQILRLKCTKFDFRWSSAPDTAGGAYSAPPDPLAAFKGLLLRARRGREGRGEKGEGLDPQLRSLDPPLT